MLPAAMMEAWLRMPSLAEALVHGGDGDFDGDAQVVADDRRGGAGATAEAVDVDDVGAGADDAGGDGSDVVDRGDLDGDRDLVLGGLLEGVDELAEVLDGVDVVMGSGGEGVGALGYAAGGGDGGGDLGAREMAADAGLGALADLDLDGGAGAEVVLVDAEAAGSALDDGAVGVLVEILVEAALAGGPVGAKLASGHGQGLLGVEADGAEAHGREDDRGLEAKLRRHLGGHAELAGAVALNLDEVRLAAKIGAKLHGLAERVDGGIGHLAGVEAEVVPDDAPGAVVAHAGEENAAGLGLDGGLLDDVGRPDVVRAVGKLVLDDGDGLLRAVGDAVMAGDAVGVGVSLDTAGEVEGLEAAALNATAAALALLVVHHLQKATRDKGRPHANSLLSGN